MYHYIGSYSFLRGVFPRVQTHAILPGDRELRHGLKDDGNWVENRTRRREGY
jgi:hypothetical protein